MKAVAIDDTEVRMVTSESAMGTTRLHNFYGQGGIMNDGPQGFLVEMIDPNSRIESHFHDVDQFQVVVSGDGRMGARKIAPISVHYADAYAPYGPIVAKEQGLGYYTLRNVSASGYWGMPENMDKSIMGRQFTRALDLEAKLPPKGGIEPVPMRDDEPDGLAIMGLRIGPDTQTKARDSDGGGQYILVCKGTLVKDGTQLPVNSLLRVEPGEPGAELQSGREGAVVLVMQFGRATERPGSDPKQLAKRDKNYKLPPSAKMN